MKTEVKKRGCFGHCRLVTRACACYRDISVKGAGDGWVREALQGHDISCSGSLKAKHFWGMPYCQFRFTVVAAGGPVLEKGPLGYGAHCTPARCAG